MITESLRLLRAAADKVSNGFPETTWTKISGPGPDQLKIGGHGGFDKLNLQEPGHRELVLQCKLDLPAETLGVRLAGQPLEGTFGSLHPADIFYNGRSVFSEVGPPVAAGPALIPFDPCLKEGRNGTIEMRIRIANYFMMNWVGLKLTTPSLRMRFEQLDVAWAQLTLADALAVSPAEKRAACEAAAMVSEMLAAPVAESQPLFERFTEILRPLRAKAAAVSVELIGHSHIDMNWLWTWADTFQVIKRDFRSVLSMMDDYPELTFSHSQPATYEVIRQTEPELFAELLKYIKAGRWEATTMQWVEPDSNMPSGEAHARQMLQGVRYTREVLGATPTIFHSPDTFGHAGNLPQLATSAGATAYYHHRANPGQENLWPAYWWEGQDGSRLLAFSTPSYNGEITAGDLARAALRAHEAGHATGIHFHGIGDHGGGPARQNLDALRRLQKTPGLPTAHCGTMAGYVRKIIDSGVALPVHRGESSTIFEGCYTTHADTKRYNRTGENLLCTADTLAAMAGLDRREDLTGVWRKVLFNQFHDILDGSAIHDVYDDNAADFREVSATATQVIEGSLEVLERGIAAGAIAVTNPLAFGRSELVMVKDFRGEGTVRLVGSHGHTTAGQYTSEGLVFVARVPALATVGYSIQEGSIDSSPPSITAVPCFAPTDPRSRNPPEGDDKGKFLRLETPHFSALVRPDCGVIVSLFDKRVNRELIGFGKRRGSDYLDTGRADLCLNVLQLTDEVPHGMSSWQLQEVENEHSLIRGATTSVVESGPVRCVLEVKHAVRSSTITQRISFYRDLPRIDFATHVDWKEIGNDSAGVPGLKASFTAHLDECNAWYETPFAAVRRPADGLEVPALRWADVGGEVYGIAVLNDSKYGYDALGCRLRLTLLRSGYDPDPVSDAGEHDIRYSLFPHPGDWRDAGVVQAGMSFNQPLLAHVVKTPPTPHDPDNETWRPQFIFQGGVQLSATKIAEDGNGRILRLYESTGRHGAIKIVGLNDASAVYETNILEDRKQALEPIDGVIELAFSPWQVRTILIEASRGKDADAKAKNA